MACVVDGDTFWIDDFKVRISDIDTPELSPPRCEYERQLGLKAKARLRELLNSGRVTLEHVDRDEDRYGRKLRTVRNEQGESIGAILVSEGVARQWDGARHPWCP
ncbi:thermonuclease family protein [Pleomorphomonas oryzae]|uniref:thermonuclease family protein n=1 Tax=Pleomorphomonas oryzae TaxID=261934 RepID=UPI003CCBFE82